VANNPNDYIWEWSDMFTQGFLFQMNEEMISAQPTRIIMQSNRILNQILEMTLSEKSNVVQNVDELLAYLPIHQHIFT